MFDKFIEPISAAYTTASSDGYSYGGLATVGAWRELAADSEDRASGVRLLLNVVETDDPEPYKDAGTMCRDIYSGDFIVSRAHSEHPLWSVSDNVNFRIVHDVLGHYGATVANGWRFAYVPTTDDNLVAEFDWRGENEACAQHFAFLHTYNMRLALFTECLGQTAWAIENGFEGIKQRAVSMEHAIEHSGEGELIDEYRRVVLKGQLGR